jgi:cytochrome b
MNLVPIQEDAAAGAQPAAFVRVWDPLVRVFHWGLVAAFVTAYVSAEEWDGLHEWAGWVVLGLIASRLVWGVVGTRHARFGDFVPSPARLLAYLWNLLRGASKRYVGHSPAGGAMIVVLLIAVTATATTGALMTTDWDSRWIKEVHEVMANLTLVLIGAHLLGVLVMSLVHRENLVRAMLTGRKRAEP